MVDILIRVEWTNPDDDVVLEEATDKVSAWAEEEARKRGILNDFIYLNYADGKQPVYERAIVPEDMKRMRRVKKTYDTAGTFEELWIGGYKLPEEGNHVSGTGAGTGEHSEL
jgi:hypothetical protein